MKNNNKKNKSSTFGAWLKERVRKFLVTLKKNPQLIPLASLAVAFFYYSFNLSSISKSSLAINKPFMGLSSFATMLFMILSFVCMLNAFPKRQKPKLPMIIIMMVLYAVVIFADIVYLNAVNYAFEPEYWNKQSLLEQYHIATAYNTALVHIILVGVTIVLVLLEPVFAKLLKKIKTSIDVEGSGNIGKIDIADED